MSAETSPQAPLIEPLAVDADGFARLAGISRALVYKLDSSGRCPAPVRIGRACRWRVADIRAWLETGCPPRDRFKAQQWAKAKGAELSRIGGGA